LQQQNSGRPAPGFRVIFVFVRLPIYGQSFGAVFGACSVRASIKPLLRPIHISSRFLLISLPSAQFPRLVETAAGEARVQQRVHA